VQNGHSCPLVLTLMVEVPCATSKSTAADKSVRPTLPSHHRDQNQQQKYKEDDAAAHQQHLAEQVGFHQIVGVRGTLRVDHGSSRFSDGVDACPRGVFADYEK
jgi:hypothetical protein